MTKSFVLKISVAVFFLALVSSITLPQTPPSAAAKKTEIVMLGTGTPRPQPDVWGPATAVIVGQKVFLVDAGVGVEGRVAAAGLPVNGVTAGVFKHLHTAHVARPSELLFTSWRDWRSWPF